MKQVSRIGTATMCVVIVFAASGCPRSNPPSGFKVTATEVVSIPGVAPFNIPLAGIPVTGSWDNDLPGTVTGNRRSFGDYTNFNGWFVVSDGRIPARWTSGVVDPNTPPVCSANVADFNVTREHPSIDWFCPHIVTSAAPAFSIVSALPPTLSINASGYSTAYGMPHLNLYGSDGLYISSNSASAVSEDGTDATFPFPTQAGGGSLAAGLYTFNMWNPGPYTQPRFVGGGFFSVGSNDTSRQAPYGVDAVTFNYAQQDCSFDGLNVYCGQYYTWSTLGGVLTLSATGQVNGTYGTITVGNQPTAIKAYGDYHYYEDRGYGGFYQSDEPSNAIVTNFGSNTVSIVDLINNSVVNTIAVGTGPIAVVLNSNQSKAYVANYGSASLSEINLSTNTQTRVAAIGAQPEALAMDPGGTALWVAGQGYISKLDLNSLSAIQSFSVSGQVTSVAVSAGQGTLVYTTVATSGGSTTFQAQQASISSGIVQGTYAQYSMSSSSYYAQAITVGGPAPGTPGWLMPGGALVSSTYGNGAAVIGTPTGFVVLDLVAKNEILEGSTPSAVRGIATDPFQGIIYLTAPDSNSLITVPLPPPQ